MLIFLLLMLLLVIVVIEEKKNEAFLNGVCVEEAIRGLEVSSNVSAVSAIGFVRKKLVELQQEMGKEGGIVMDGWIADWYSGRCFRLGNLLRTLMR